MKGVCLVDKDIVRALFFVSLAYRSFLGISRGSAGEQNLVPTQPAYPM